MTQSGGNFLDALLTGIKVVQQGGVSVPAEPTINFVSGATVTDDPANKRTNITLTSNAITFGLDLATVTSSTQHVVGWYGKALDTNFQTPGDAYMALYSAASTDWKAVSMSGDVTITAAGVATVASAAKGITQLTGEVTAGPGGGPQAAIVTGPFSTASLAWLKTVSGPTLSHAAQTTDAACTDMTLQPQFAYASATGTNRAPGNYIINVGVPTNSGTTEAGLVLQRNGSVIARVGNLSGVSGTGMWLGSGAVTASNFICESDGTSFTYYNTPSNLGFLASGSTFLLYMTGTNTMYLGGSSGTAPIVQEWSTSTAPTIRSGTSATSLTVGTNKSAASLILQGDAETTVATITTFVELSSKQRYDQIAAPGAAAANTVDVYVDNADQRLKSISSAGHITILSG
jgi:hypothetical protein